MQRDVLEGFVSIESALEQYGVALAADNLEIDAEATDAARGAARAPRPAVDRGPTGREWLARLGVAE